MIPYGRQDINLSDIESVKEVLCSDWLTQGPMLPCFEQAVAKYCRAKHAVAMNSATSALHVACLALGLGSGDILWTSPISFVASANCALYCGAKVDFVDIDPLTYNMSAARLEEKLKTANKVGKLPKIVVPVHLCGQPCDMESIHALSQQYGFKVIEDASHAIGGCYQDEPIGNCRYSDITIFSFHPVKIITTGEGGMALTNTPALANQMVLLRSHGITRDPEAMTHEPDGPWYYQQIALGYNYRMTEIQAALGLSQMQRLDDFVARRHVIANRYDEAFLNLPITPPRQIPDGHSAYHLYVITLPEGTTVERHLTVFNVLRSRDIGVTLHYIPIHTQPYYTTLGFRQGDYPVAEDYYRRAISLPMYPTLKENDQAFVIKSVQESLQ